VWQDKFTHPGWRRWAGNLGFFLLLATVFFGVRYYQQRSLVEGPAPALRESLVQGESFDLAAHRGRPVLVYFWATWCAVCKLEQGAIESVAGDHTVVGVAMRSGPDAEVMKYLRENSLAVPVVNDPDGAIADAWGVRATPTSFVLDGAGAIRFREVGYTSQIGLRLRLWMASF
jgi:thiol-disulfide isomerase/thioredoxin